MQLAPTPQNPGHLMTFPGKLGEFVESTMSTCDSLKLPIKQRKTCCFRMKCGRGDLNPHALRHQILSLARLPISPPERGRERNTPPRRAPTALTRGDGGECSVFSVQWVEFAGVRPLSTDLPTFPPSHRFPLRYPPFAISLRFTWTMMAACTSTARPSPVACIASVG